MLPAGFLLAGRYRILQPLGQGGFATVYKAQDRKHNHRRVALKQIHLESLSLQEMIDASDGYNREVTHLSSLRHRCLPRIYDYFTDEQHWYIVMEYLAGKTLEEHLRSTRRGFLSVNRTLEIGLALCDVFHYLYMQHPPIIFRDIKPANIILTRSGRISLIDFGIARLYRPIGKDTGPPGTPGYAAPQQYGRQAHTTPQTDIYGLGATLQTLLTSKEPLEILQDGIPLERARAIPTELQTCLARMLERDARRRPHNMAEVKQALQQIKAQRPVQKIKAAGAKRFPCFPASRCCCCCCSIFSRSRGALAALPTVPGAVGGCARQIRTAARQSRKRAQTDWQRNHHSPLAAAGQFGSPGFSPLPPLVHR